MTGRILEAFEKHETLSKTAKGWGQGLVLCLPEAGARLGQRTVVTELGPDREALRPQDRVALTGMKELWRKELANSFKKTQSSPPVTLKAEGTTTQITDGAVVIAAITSCTNTSNPSVMVGAGLLARNAVARGLRSKPWVKTSMAPGSRVVHDYMEAAGVMPAIRPAWPSVAGRCFFNFSRASARSWRTASYGKSDGIASLSIFLRRFTSSSCRSR